MARARIIWDDECGLCKGLMDRIVPFLEPGRFDFVPMRDWIESLSPDDRRIAELRDEMRVITESGGLLGGADAVLYILRRAAWLWPIGILGAVPVMILCSRWTYRMIAAWRRTSATTCRTRRQEPVE